MVGRRRLQNRNRLKGAGKNPPVLNDALVIQLSLHVRVVVQRGLGVGIVEDGVFAGHVTLGAECGGRKMSGRPYRAVRTVTMAEFKGLVHGVDLIRDAQETLGEIGDSCARALLRPCVGTRGIVRPKTRARLKILNALRRTEISRSDGPRTQPLSPRAFRCLCKKRSRAGLICESFRRMLAKSVDEWLTNRVRFRAFWRGTLRIAVSPSNRLGTLYLSHFQRISHRWVGRDSNPQPTP